MKTPCANCAKFTESTYVRRGTYKCSECERDKSLSDYYFYEDEIARKKEKKKK